MEPSGLKRSQFLAPFGFVLIVIQARLEGLAVVVGLLTWLFYNSYRFIFWWNECSFKCFLFLNFENCVDFTYFLDDDPISRSLAPLYTVVSTFLAWLFCNVIKFEGLFWLDLVSMWFSLLVSFDLIDFCFATTLRSFESFNSFITYGVFCRENNPRFGALSWFYGVTALGFEWFIKEVLSWLLEKALMREIRLPPFSFITYFFIRL